MGIRGSEEGQSSYVGPARSATGRIHATSVDAPFRARGNVRIAVARSRMLPSVRPLARPLDRRPAWEFADRVHINAAYSRYGVASVDAPFRARGNVRIAVARSRMLPSVRPLARPL